MKYPISVGFFKPNERAYRYINEILATTQITYGKFSKQFEQEFSSLHSCRYGVLSNSGTSSLQVALQALKEIHGWKDGAEVIVPATTFIATANVVVHCGLKPVFVDVNKNTFNMSIHSVLSRTSDNTRAIIPVHMFGQSADVMQISGLVNRSIIKIVEDSCETMFATHEGMAVGSWGDIGCFSLYAAHILVGGVGGISITSNRQYAEKMRSLVNHGMTIDSLNMDKNCSPNPVSNRYFSFDSHGHSFRVTEFEAALALSQLKEWRKIVRARRVNAQHLTARLAREDWLTTPYTSFQNTHSYMMYPIVLNGADREELIDYLGSYGIQTRDIPSIMGNKIFDLKKSEFPVSYNIKQNGFYVGCHQGLGIKEMDYIADRLIEYGKRQKC